MSSVGRAALLSHTVDLPCTCGEKLYLPLGAMLQGKSAVCAGCGARLRLDPKTNAGAVAALENLVEKLGKLERENVRLG